MAKLTQSDKQLFDAISVGDLGLVKRLVKQGANINVQDEKGATPLQVAVDCKKLRIVNYLVEEQDADVKIQDRWGWTAFHCAARLGQLPIVKSLLEKTRIDCEAKDKHGWTALFYAAKAGSLETVKYLIEKRLCTVDGRDNNGKTLLHAAVQEESEMGDHSGKGTLAVIKYLLERIGLPIDDIKNTDKTTALYDAILWGRLPVIQYLINKGADINIQNNYGGTPLLEAIVEQLQDIVEFLVESGATITIHNILEACGNNRFHCYKKRLAIVRCLVDKSNFDMRGELGGECLLQATIFGGLEIVQYLVQEIGVPLDATNQDGNTALGLAYEDGSIDIIEFLETKTKE